VAIGTYVGAFCKPSTLTHVTPGFCSANRADTYTAAMRTCRICQSGSAFFAASSHRLGSRATAENYLDRRASPRLSPCADHQAALIANGDVAILQ
jgi:hypothetical protein